jgi:hypothetical protein
MVDRNGAILLGIFSKLQKMTLIFRRGTILSLAQPFWNTTEHTINQDSC